MIWRLPKEPVFPPPELADPDGLLAIEGDLSVERLIEAYKNGIYPCYTIGEPILWWSPEMRGVIPLDGLRINRTLRNILNRKLFDFRINTAFEEVMRRCSNPRRDGGGAWITEEMVEAYIRLHKLGLAHSVEAWDSKGAGLVGGLYGVSLGGLFAGESMFYDRPYASKAALVHLVERLKTRGYKLLDCQMVTEATGSMGAVEIKRKEYLKLLADALLIDTTFV